MTEARRSPAAPPDRFDPKLFARKPCVVLGLGRSGIAAANLLASKGFAVLVSDSRPRKEVRPSAAQLKPGVKWEAGGHSGRVLKARFAVKSPGIPSRAPVLEMLSRASVPVFSELEVALAFCKARTVVAVTGTNGKSTTTLLAAAIFKAARRRVVVAGNIGTPASALLPKARKGDVAVLEASSYQLEDSACFHPGAAALLNVTADHIDHHGSMARYIEAKARVFLRQSRGDVCVFNGDDPIAVQLSRRCPARRLFFSRERSALSHAWTQRGNLYIKLPGAKEPTKLATPRLPGAHNLENAMAAALLAIDRGAPPSAVARAFRSFQGVEHRIEDCGVFRGIRCVNDSKATNVESTLTALRAFPEAAEGGPRILLILGGLHKGWPYTPLRPHLGREVKGILAIGSAARKIEEDLSGAVPILPCGTLEEAVRTGLQIGRRGDMLLLSPACASFDQFKDFEDRGRTFKELARRLAP